VLGVATYFAIARPRVAEPAAVAPIAAAPAATAAARAKVAPTATARPAPQRHASHHHHHGADGHDADGTGRVIVGREASSLRVFVDGTFIGDAPVDYEVEPGVHEVTLVRDHDGAPDKVTTLVRVAAGRRYRLNTGDRD
jgi:hypothetical protein